MTGRIWICALFTLLSAGVSAGFSVDGLFRCGSSDSLAYYAASRSVALLLTVLIAIGIRSRMAIAFLGIAMAIVQTFDGIIGALAHDPSKTYGPAVSATGLVTAVSAGTTTITAEATAFNGSVSSSATLTVTGAGGGAGGGSLVSLTIIPSSLEVGNLGATGQFLAPHSSGI